MVDAVLIGKFIQRSGISFVNRRGDVKIFAVHELLHFKRDGSSVTVCTDDFQLGSVFCQREKPANRAGYINFVVKTEIKRCVIQM